MSVYFFLQLDGSTKFSIPIPSLGNVVIKSALDFEALSKARQTFYTLNISATVSFTSDFVKLSEYPFIATLKPSKRVLLNFLNFSVTWCHFALVLKFWCSTRKYRLSQNSIRKSDYVIHVFLSSKVLSGRVGLIDWFMILLFLEIETENVLFSFS